MNSVILITVNIDKEKIHHLQKWGEYSGNRTIKKIKTEQVQSKWN